MRSIIGPALCTLACLSSTTGCQTMPQASLVYASRQTLGINVSTPSQTQPEPLNLTIGFGNQDIAYVPVVADGCQTIDADYQRNYAKPKNGDKDKQLADCLTAKAGQKRAKSAHGNNSPESGSHDDDNDGAQTPTRARAIAQGESSAGAHTRLVADTPALPATPAIVEIPPTRDSGPWPYDLLHKDGNAMKIEDASSVLGTFGSGLHVGSDTSNSLGKFFSTGVAAQQRAEGFAYKQAAEGYSGYVTGLSQCVANMKKSLPNASDSEILTNCSAGLSALLKQKAIAPSSTSLSASTDR